MSKSSDHRKRLAREKLAHQVSRAVARAQRDWLGPVHLSPQQVQELLAGGLATVEGNQVRLAGEIGRYGGVRIRS